MISDDPRADLTESMVPVACDLACRVRDGDAEHIARLAEARGWDTETTALLVVLAAMVPVDDATPNDLLEWTGGLDVTLEWRQAQLPLTVREETERAIAEAHARLAALPPRELEPCPSLAAYRRHKARGEPYEACGCGEAARAAWRAKARVRAAEAGEAAREEASDAAA